MEQRFGLFCWIGDFWLQLICLGDVVCVAVGRLLCLGA